MQTLNSKNRVEEVYLGGGREERGSDVVEDVEQNSFKWGRGEDETKAVEEANEEAEERLEEDVAGREAVEEV